MSFGVMNAPALFQRLMQRALLQLVTEADSFVVVYLDDVIVFSHLLDTHLQHLMKVFACLRDANLKLNASKYKYMSEEVKYLGHIVIPQGLKPNTRSLDAVGNFQYLLM